MSLYGDALADERWDYRIFRCFNLLEGIAGEILPAGSPVTDESGAPLIQASGRPYTTNEAREKVYELLKHGATRAKQALQNFGSSAGFVGQEAWFQGRSGASPDRSSMIMVMKAWGSWKPRAAERMRPMAALLDSEIPLLSFHSMAASSDAR